MELGGHDVGVVRRWLASHLFDEPMVRQRFRHRYEVEPAYLERLSGAGLCFSGRHPEQPIMQILELPRVAHPFFIAAQFHPELLSRPLQPHPMFMGLIAAGLAQSTPTPPPRAIRPPRPPRPPSTACAAAPARAGRGVTERKIVRPTLRRTLDNSGCCCVSFNRPR